VDGCVVEMGVGAGSFPVSSRSLLAGAVAEREVAMRPDVPQQSFPGDVSGAQMQRVAAGNHCIWCCS
jgi:hypothetical protein